MLPKYKDADNGSQDSKKLKNNRLLLSCHNTIPNYISIFLLFPGMLIIQRDLKRKTVLDHRSQHARYQALGG